MATSQQLRGWIHDACLLEATARKPGNVHPEASFDDCTFADFVQSAEAIAPVLAEARETGPAQAILAAVESTRRSVGTNSNLGIILLLAPLAAIADAEDDARSLARVLDAMSVADSGLVYEAIRRAHPGGLGHEDDQDLSAAPTLPFRQIMALAADHDRIAAEYAYGFPLVLHLGRNWFQVDDFAETWEAQIIDLHLHFMAHFPDTLIARKCGRALADESAQRAAAVIDRGGPCSPAGRQALDEFDEWLREDGHRRNPGTTADLIAASLFMALRAGHIECPRLGDERDE